MRSKRVAIAAIAVASALMSMAHADDGGGGTSPTREQLLGQAEAALAQGDTVAASGALDRASMMLHSPDTEMLQVRALMQAGEYRHALAFSAHVAGAHVESSGAAAQYAWLLRAGGQRDFAERVLRSSLERFGDDPLLIDVRQAFTKALPVTTPALLRGPHHLAPESLAASDELLLPASAKVISSGVLAGDGRIAIVPSDAVAPDRARVVWVRNGMGRTVRARVDPATQPLARLGATVLRLDGALSMQGLPASTVKEPFAGSAGFAFEYAPSATGSPAWPWMTQGFLGAYPREGELRNLGIEVASDGRHGGPVLDAQGRVVGIVLRNDAGQAMLLSQTRWASLLGAADAPATNTTNTTNTTIPTRASIAPAMSAGPSIPMPGDEAYEHGLRVALQVLVAP